jgi:hypothetical protein
MKYEMLCKYNDLYKELPNLIKEVNSTELSKIDINHMSGGGNKLYDINFLIILFLIGVFCGGLYYIYNLNKKMEYHNERIYELENKIIKFDTINIKLMKNNVDYKKYIENILATQNILQNNKKIYENTLSNDVLYIEQHKNKHVTPTTKNKLLKQKSLLIDTETETETETTDQVSDAYQYGKHSFQENESTYEKSEVSNDLLSNNEMDIFFRPISQQ